MIISFKVSQSIIIILHHNFMCCFNIKIIHIFIYLAQDNYGKAESKYNFLFDTIM